MKILHIFLNRLKGYIQTNKIIFMIFVCSGIITTLSFIYCFGNLLSYMTMRNSQESYFRRYFVVLDEQTQINSDTMDNLITQGFQDASLCKFLDEERMTYVFASVKETEKWYARKGRVEFTNTELKNADKVLILPTLTQEISAKATKAFNTLLGNQFTVIGTHTLFEEFRIPYRTFVDSNISPDMIQLTWNNPLTHKNNEKILTILNNQFPESYVKSPMDWHDANAAHLPLELGILITLYGISVLSFAFLMKYLVEKNYHENVIYFLSGASKSAVIKILFIESFFISLMIGITACLLHAILYNPLFSKLNMVDNIVYQLSDYFLILISVVLMSCFVQFPFIISSYRSTVIQAKQRNSD